MINQEEFLQIKDDLLKMENMSEYYFNWFEEGGAMVILVNYDCYVLFQVVQYGGGAQIERAYHTSELDKLIEKGLSWT